jgi:hypothetical protein
LPTNPTLAGEEVVEEEVEEDNLELVQSLFKEGISIYSLSMTCREWPVQHVELHKLKAEAAFLVRP